MARVIFGSGLSGYTGGAAEVDVEATRVRELLEILKERFPELDGVLDEMAVAIDGEIHNDPLYQSLRPNSEVHFLPKIGGGR